MVGWCQQVRWWHYLQYATPPSGKNHIAAMKLTTCMQATCNEQQARKSVYNYHTTSKKLLPEFRHSCRHVAGTLGFLCACTKIFKSAISGNHSQTRVDGYEYWWELRTRYFWCQKLTINMLSRSLTGSSALAQTRLSVAEQTCLVPNWIRTKTIIISWPKTSLFRWDSVYSGGYNPVNPWPPLKLWKGQIYTVKIIS